MQQQWLSIYLKTKGKTSTSAEDMLKFAWPEMRTSPSIEAQMKLLEAWYKLSSGNEQERFIEAISADFSFNVDFLDLLLDRSDSARNVVKFDVPWGVGLLMPAIKDPAARAKFVEKYALNLRDVAKIHESAGALFELNAEAPTGAYSLDLALPMDRCVAELLLVLNRWETALWFARSNVDISQHGSRAAFRNELWQEAPLDTSTRRFDAEEFHLPNHGRFSFDYVSWRRHGREPPQALPDELWNKFLDAFLVSKSSSAVKVKTLAIS